MRKIITVRNMVTLIVCLLLLVVGLGRAEHYIPEPTPQPQANRQLVPVHTESLATGVKLYLFYDVNTNVMYMISRQGDIQILLNEDGSPALYEGGK